VGRHGKTFEDRVFWGTVPRNQQRQGKAGRVKALRESQAPTFCADPLESVTKANGGVGKKLKRDAGIGRLIDTVV
jgi:hypothetical protein